MDQITEHLLEIIILIAGAATGILILWQKLYKGVCSICENIAHIYKMPKRVNVVYQELIASNGHSIKEKVDRLIKNQELFVEKTKIILDDHPVALVETDKDGLVTWANYTYLNLVDRSLEEIQGNGWVNIICEKDREKVFEDWRAAVEQERPYEGRICIQKPNGDEFYAMGYGFPIEVEDEIHGYLAKVKIIVEVSPHA